MILTLILSLLIACAPGYAFDTKNAREIVNTLASDPFEGRRSGHPGGVKTEEYIAGLMQEYGLEPGGRGGYFQEVPILVTREEAASLTLMNHELGKIPFQQGIDYTLVTHSGSGSLMGNVVIAGLGIFRPDKERDDYGDLDLRGKIVVIIRAAPESPYDFGEDRPRGKTLAWAKERGAAAILWHANSFPLNGAAIKKDDYDPDLPLVYIGDRILRLLLDESGYSRKTYLKAVKSKPIPLKTDYEMWISVRNRKLPVESSRNVLGIVYGNDPVLQNEVIVVGAHMDHIGRNAQRVPYNGADDNGSGTAVVTELARTFAAGEPLKRSLLFMTFTAEEDGLIGSDHFVANATIPFGNIACMLNFDMVGQGDGVVGMAGGHLLGTPWSEYAEALSSEDKSRLKLYREDGYAGSDNGPFMRAGAPTLSFWSSGGHPFYHHYTDDAAGVVDSVFENVGERAEDFLRFIGNYTGPLASRSDSLRNLARIGTTIDFQGFFVDPSGTLPRLSAVSAAWLPHDATLPVSEMVSRMAELHAICKERDLESSGLSDAISAHVSDRGGVFLAIPEVALVARPPQQIATLTRQGLSLVGLSPGNTPASGKMSEETEELLIASGVYADVPLDFATSSRVATWKDHAIVRATLADFAALSDDFRDALLNSEALVFLDVDPDLNDEQIESIQPARQRLVHLSFGASYPELRETEMKQAMRRLYRNDMNRGDILLLTGGNLQRFLKN